MALAEVLTPIEDLPILGTVDVEVTCRMCKGPAAHRGHLEMIGVVDGGTPGVKEQVAVRCTACRTLFFLVITLRPMRPHERRDAMERINGAPIPIR